MQEYKRYYFRSAISPPTCDPMQALPPLLPIHNFSSRSTRRIAALACRRSSTHNLLHHRVEGVAFRALNAQKVPFAVVTLGFAVVAHDVDNALQVAGHGMFGNVPGARFPCGGHALLADDRLFANGAAIIKAGKLAKTVCVNGVSAGKILGRLSAGKHVFATHRAVVLVLVAKALMGVEDTDGDAHAALAAVAKGFDASDATKAALSAMEGLLRLIIDE
jgi:hypothetical protein